ncbi:MAG: SDR family oxidoreductase [Bryobacteraceae bacterium]
MAARSVFISGATGYLGSALIPVLLERGLRVKALARPASLGKVPRGCPATAGNPLDAATFQHALGGMDTLVHLTGVSHPAPWKAAQFRAIDLKSLEQSLAAMRWAGVRHLVYVSVAHPAPVMKEYVDVRQECEERIADSRIPASILRPWYILGPGHRWPQMLRPMYALAEMIPSLRDGARRLGLVRLDQMVQALAWCVENPPAGLRVLDVPAIRGERADLSREPKRRRDREREAASSIQIPS